MNRSFWLILSAIFIFGFFLRVIFLPQNALTFGYDQARDAVQALSIAHGDFKILGPSASTPGLYHGVLYFYVLAPAYLLGAGSPIIAAYWIAFINTLTIFICGILTYWMTKNRKAAFFAAFLYAISFEATQYATWLSNPTLGMLTVPLLYLSLWGWVGDSPKQFKRYAPVILGVALGFSIQAEIFLAYHIVPVAIWLYVSRKQITRKSFAVFAIALLASLSTMIASEFKFGFRGIAGFMSLLVSSDALVASKGFGDFVVLFLNQLGRVYAAASYPSNVGYGAAIVLIFMWISLRETQAKVLSWQKFLATWLLSHITVTTLGGTSTPFLLVGISPAVSILLGIYVSKLFVPKYWIFGAALLLVFVYGNLNMIKKENPHGSTFFSIQKDMVLSKQLAAIDYMYESARGEAFSVNSLTSPLWVNIVWTYLFNWHGNNKYAYTPGWTGRGQEGQLITLPTDTQNKQIYLILEPMAGIPARYLDETISQEDGKSRLIEEKSFGEIRIQKRERL